jgi:hypothetical protein
MSYLADIDSDRALTPLQAASCTYRIALGPRAGQKSAELKSGARPTRALHASTVRQRARLQPTCSGVLCRRSTQGTRTPVSLYHPPRHCQRTTQRNHAGDVVLQLKSAYQDGTTHIVMSPLEFMQRLAALVPRPRLHLIRFHGMLAPHAKLRAAIVPTPENAPEYAADHAQAHGAPARTLAQASLRYRHRTLPALRRHLEDYRCHRRARRNHQDTHPSGPAYPAAALPGTATRSVPSGLILKSRPVPQGADDAARPALAAALRALLPTVVKS